MVPAPSTVPLTVCVPESARSRVAPRATVIPPEWVPVRVRRMMPVLTVTVPVFVNGTPIWETALPDDRVMSPLLTNTPGVALASQSRSP